jgi:hypothetical protein
LKKLNWFLIGATAVAAIVCAFGDIIAGHYIVASHTSPDHAAAALCC